MNALPRKHLIVWPALLVFSVIGLDASDPAWPPQEAAADLNHSAMPADKGAVRPSPKTSIYVAPRGDDTNPGTRRRPFATLEGARDYLRGLKLQNRLPQGGVAVVIRGGDYRVSRTFKLTKEDGGRENAPVVYQAAKGERPVFNGGVRLSGFERINDDHVLKRLPGSVRDRVLQVNLNRNGITNIWPLALGGFASGRGFTSHRVMELYWDGQALPMARGPDAAFLRTGEVCEPAKETSYGSVWSKVGRFKYEGDVPSRWQGETDLLLYGYWFFGWADSYERVSSIDAARREVVLEPPYHSYGYRKGQPFCAVNALSELDRPGEWCLDTRKATIYVLPPSDPSKALVEISAADFPMVELSEVSNLALEGLTWELGCVDGILIRGGTNCLIAGCTIRRFGGNGVEIVDGTGHGVLSSDIYMMGRGGVTMAGGDRRLLIPGRHFVENCHVYDLSRIDHTYTPAVVCSGVGNRISQNWFHDIPSSAMRVGGNDHLVEFNEINRVVLESDDQGGVDMWGNPTFLGNVFRNNYFHHIGNWRKPEEGPDCGQAGIRLDDAISGVVISRNIFFKCGAGRLGFGGVQIHGGKDNVLDGNVFANCRWAVSFSPWQEGRWREFIKEPVTSAEITPSLYAEKYPPMARLEREANVNWLRRNIVLNCGTLLHRDGGGARMAGNIVLSRNPGFRDPVHGDFSSSSKAAEANLSGMLGGGLMFDHVGLYRDRYRKAIPTPLLNRMRAEE